MSERLNVKGMLVEAGRLPEHPFNPRLDITPDQWQGLENFRKECSEGARWAAFSTMVAAETLLSGKKIPLSEAELKEVYYIFEDAWVRGRWSEIPASLLQRSILDIGAYTKTQHEGILSERDRLAAVSNWEGFLALAAATTVAGWKMELTAAQQKEILEQVPEWEKLPFGQFMRIAFQATIVGIKFPLKPEYVVKIKNERESAARAGDWYAFATSAAIEATLTADEIKPPPPPTTGLQLIHYDVKPMLDGLPPQPQARSF